MLSLFVEIRNCTLIYNDLLCFHSYIHPWLFTVKISNEKSDYVGPGVVRVTQEIIRQYRRAFNYCNSWAASYHGIHKQGRWEKWRWGRYIGIAGRNANEGVDDFYRRSSGWPSILLIGGIKSVALKVYSGERQGAMPQAVRTRQIRLIRVRSRPFV